jgi:hypothetical protein
MHAKTAKFFIEFLRELCGIPLRILRENFIPRKERRVGCTQRTQSFLLDFLASFAAFLCAFCVKIFGFSQRPQRSSFNFLARLAKLLCAAAAKSNH